MKSSYAAIVLSCILASCTNGVQEDKSNSIAAAIQQTTPQNKEMAEIRDSTLKDSHPAESWLEGIFQCEGFSTGKYCYYLDKEDALCTPRFRAFLQDANEIYGPSNLSDEELPMAEAAYKAKWRKIYPLYTQETWLFGRGNDDALDIQDVKIEKVSDSKFIVFVDYGHDVRTKNEVQLVHNGESYKIDYCKTTFLH